MNYSEHEFATTDGLNLYYRDYAGSAAKPPLLCLTGLTRNAKDYHDFASRLAPGRRVLCLDYRGRGRSAYDPNWQNYQPPTYMGDVITMLTALKLEKVVLVGTSLGGIVSMGLANMVPQLLAGVILNDIGPDLDNTGLGRIAGYVGNDTRMPDFVTAGRGLKAMFQGAYPDLPEARWTEFAERIFVADPARGDLRLNYDLALAKPLQQQAELQAKGDGPAFDLWPLYKGLREIPTLAFRGGLSDLLTAATFERMGDDMPRLTRVTVPNRGHVPLLDEPECVAAIDAFLAHV